MIHALVTGATDGIGQVTAQELYRKGLTVLVHGRTEKKAVAGASALGSRAVGVWGDLGSLEQVRQLATQVEAALAGKPLDVLLNNAGVFETERHESADGHELTMAVNHLAPFLLTKLLLPSLVKAPQGRVVNVSSVAHARGRLDLSDPSTPLRTGFDFNNAFDGYVAYAASKLANVYFTHALARRLERTAATAYALHPGVITTKLLRKGFGMGGAPRVEGAATSVYCATAPELAKVNGRYYSDAREVDCAAHAKNQELEEELWALSEKLTAAR